MSTVLTSSFLLCLAAISCKAATEGENGVNVISSVPSTLFKALYDCSTFSDGKETVLCIRQRVSRFVENLNSASELSIVPDYVALVKENASSSSNDGNGTFFEKKSRSLVDTVSSVLSNRRILIRLPSFSTLIHSEGRGKKNDKGYAVVGMMMAGSMLAMGMAALAALAGKALAISMAALMMAAIAAMKKGHEGGGGGGHHHSYEVVSLPVHGHQHRSLVHHSEPPVFEPTIKPFAYENFNSEPS